MYKYFFLKSDWRSTPLVFCHAIFQYWAARWCCNNQSWSKAKQHSFHFVRLIKSKYLTIKLASQWHFALHPIKPNWYIFRIYCSFANQWSAKEEFEWQWVKITFSLFYQWGQIFTANSWHNIWQSNALFFKLFSYVFHIVSEFRSF